MTYRPAGAYLTEAALTLVIDVLEAHPEGMSNRDVGLATGLNLAISKQEGYITWTILQFLLETGRVAKEGALWRLIPRR